MSDLIDKGVNVFLLDAEEMVKYDSIYPEVLAELNTLMYKGRLNPYQELQKWRKLGIKMMTLMKLVAKLNNGYIRENKRLTNDYGDRGNKRWTPDEDTALIEMAVQDNNMLKMTAIFGRTESAIRSRLSYLVGIKRLQETVDGRFLGVLDGEEVSGIIKGIVTKE